MSNPTIDAYVQQVFGDKAPPALSNVAFLTGLNSSGASGQQNRMAIPYAKMFINNLASSQDMQKYYQDASNVLSNRYVQLAEGRYDTSGVQQDIQALVDKAPSYGVDAGNLVNTINTTVNTQISDYNARQANRDTGGSFFDNFISAIASPQGIATLGLAVATGGSSLALTVGEMAMGATAAEAAATVAGVAAGTATATAGAATVGAALVGSATSATLAAVSGGDVTKSAIAGAISGGAAANAGDIANAVTGGNVQAIAASTGLTPAQVANTISNSITAGVITAGVTGGNVATAVASTLAASGMSAEVQNTIANNLPDMSGTAKLVGNVAGVATKAAVSGSDIGTAIQNSIPNIIGGQLQDTGKTEATKQAPAAETTTTTTSDTGTTFAPLASGGGVVSDIEPTTPLVPVKDATVSIGQAEVLPSTAQTGMAFVDANSPTGFTDATGKPINPDGTPYTPEAVTPTKDVTTPEITPTVVPKDTVAPTQTQQVIDLISQPIKAGEGGPSTTVSDTGIGNGTITTATTTTTTPETTTPEKPVQDVPTETTTDVSKDASKDTTKQVASSPALTRVLSPSIIPTKASATTGFGPSTAYLGQALGTVSPDSGLTGGPPVLSGEEGKKRNVWNIESLRNALGI